MSIGLVGRKAGMTRIFTENGESVPVSVIEVEANRVTQVKTVDNDGYNAIQVTTGTRRPALVSKPAAGVFAKAKTGPGRGFWEFRLNDSDVGKFEPGAEIKADIFSEGQIVDVAGVTRGKGFAGTIKRWNFTMGDATHGNSLSHRSPGSIGQRQTPGRVFKGKKMAGHMGNANETVQNLRVVRVDAERNLLLVRGAIPGAPGGDVIVRPASKSR